MSGKLANHEVVTIAVFLLGGDTKYVDTEDVAIKANEIAPGRFSWRKYKDQINIENVRTFLSDAKKQKNGSLVLGTGSDGWMLTEAGLQIARKRAAELDKADLSRPRTTAKERNWLKRERVRIVATTAFRKFSEGETNAITVEDLEQLFRLTNYVYGKARIERVGRIVNYFGDDEELGGFVRALAERLEGENNNDKHK